MAYGLPKYYYRDIPAYVMEESITGMMEGKQEPTPGGDGGVADHRARTGGGSAP